LNDIVAYAIAFVAAHLQDKGQKTAGFTYAFHRAELVGAFFNGVFLLALALSIFLQSLERFVNLEPVKTPVLVLIIGCIGLLLNIVSILVVHDHAGHSHGNDNSPVNIVGESLNPGHVVDSVHAQHNHTLSPPAKALQANLGLVGVLVHLLGDAVNNLGVIIAAVILWKVKSPHRFYADPTASIIISLMIFASAIPMTRKSGRILLEAAPLHLDFEKLRNDLLSLPDVLAIHDFHLWHLSQSVVLASLHVCVPPGTTLEQWETTEQDLQHCFLAYGVNHVTISPELQKDSQSGSISTEEITGGCSGCAIDLGQKASLKKRHATIV